MYGIIGRTIVCTFFLTFGISQQAKAETATAGDVTAAYYDLLGHAPGPEGMSYWSSQNLSVAELRSQIAQSPEHRAYVAPTVAAAYKEFLGRDPEQGGKDYWEQIPLTREEIRSRIQNSDEGRAYAQKQRDQANAEVAALQQRVRDAEARANHATATANAAAAQQADTQERLQAVTSQQDFLIHSYNRQIDGGALGNTGSGGGFGARTFIAPPLNYGSSCRHLRNEALTHCGLSASCIQRTIAMYDWCD